VDREAVLVGLEVKVGSAQEDQEDQEDLAAQEDLRVDAVVDLVVKVVMRRSDLGVLMVLSA
jgi:hypothetical protein